MGGTQSVFDNSGPEERFAAGPAVEQPLARAGPARGFQDSGATNPAGRIASPAAGLAATNAFAANRFDSLWRRDDIGFDEFGGTLDDGVLEAAPPKPRPLGDTIFGDASMKTPRWRSPTMPAVDDLAAAANRRLADSLSNRSNEGELPKLAARALWENGSGNAVFEHADLLRQIEVTDPARATRFDRAVRQRLPRGATPMAAAAPAPQPAAAPTDVLGSGNSPPAKKEANNQPAQIRPIPARQGQRSATPRTGQS